jgi:hypothetical protein
VTTNADLLTDRIVDFLDERMTKAEALALLESAKDNAELWIETNLSDPREPRHAPSMIGSVDRR